METKTVLMWPRPLFTIRHNYQDCENVIKKMGNVILRKWDGSECSSCGATQ